MGERVKRDSRDQKALRDILSVCRWLGARPVRPLIEHLVILAILMTVLAVLGGGR